MMKISALALVLVAATTITGAALAASHGAAAPMAGAPASAALGSQQSRMASCNAEAGEMKGDTRKAFMKTCLSAKKRPANQQDRMKSCNADAKDMKGDDRKVFMKKCLSS